MHSSHSSLSLALLAAVSMTATAGIATQDIIVDFDDQIGGLPGAPTDGMFSEYVTFSTDPAHHSLVILSGAGFVGGSNPNALSALDSAEESYDGDIYMDFTSAAQNVSFDILADNDQGTIAYIAVSHADDISYFDVIGNGDISDPISFDFSDLIDVTTIEICSITDEFGLAIDNLAFSVPVPAPSALAMVGMGLLTVSRRRR